MPRVFPGTPIAFKDPHDQLGMRKLLLQAFPAYWPDMLEVYQKVTQRPFGYMVLDLHPIVMIGNACLFCHWPWSLPSGTRESVAHASSQL